MIPSFCLRDRSTSSANQRCIIGGADVRRGVIQKQATAWHVDEVMLRQPKQVLGFILAMSDLDFRDVFRPATGFPEPNAYQCRLACGRDATLGNIASLRHGVPGCSQLINLPTGLGKTVVLALGWIWNRFLHPDSPDRNPWPRRWSAACRGAHCPSRLNPQHKPNS